jgi:hypothetical protein
MRLKALESSTPPGRPASSSIALPWAISRLDYPASLMAIASFALIAELTLFVWLAL